MKGEERKEFLKEYKMSLISGSILTISPSLAGILLWDRLPEKIATHFDQHNLANGWSSKPMAVFGIPFLLLLIHLFCVFFTANDPKRKNINRRIFTMIPASDGEIVRILILSGLLFLMNSLLLKTEIVFAVILLSVYSVRENAFV